MTQQEYRQMEELEKEAEAERKKAFFWRICAIVIFVVFLVTFAIKMITV